MFYKEHILHRHAYVLFVYLQNEKKKAFKVFYFLIHILYFI